MKEKNNLEFEEVSGKTDHDGSVPNQTGKTKEEMKINVKQFKKSTQLYFSSPCMLSELQDNEDITNL